MLQRKADAESGEKGSQITKENSVSQLKIISTSPYGQGIYRVFFVTVTPLKVLSTDK